jgi:peptide/nickel transport system permease protein
MEIGRRPPKAILSRQTRPKRLRESTWKTFTRNPVAVLGTSIVVFVVLFSYLGPVLYPTDQVHTNLTQIRLPPSAAFPLGTDDLGYNVLGRLMAGGRASISIAVAAALLASAMGTVYGAISGFVGGSVDSIMMRVVDALIAVPALLLLLLLASMFRPTPFVMIVAIAVISWVIPARLVRGETRALRSREFIEASIGAGAGMWRIIFKHVLPNVIGVVVVQTTFQVADAILLLAALSFLGLGPPPPATNWGSMLNQGLNYAYANDWWLIYPAGIAIIVTVVAFNLLGDALRDSLDVRLQRR